jgi:chromosome segregation ATPase
MDCFVLNPSTGPFTESQNLLKLLQTLEQDLEQPYIERRLKSVTQKSSLLDELQDTVHELNQREKDLLACIGIAKMLVSNNGTLLQENNELKLDVIRIKSHSQLLSDEIARLKEELEIAEEKYVQVNHTLVNTETEFIKLCAEVKIKAETGEKPSRKVSVDRYEAELFEISTKFMAEKDFLLAAKLEAEKKVKHLDLKHQESQKTLSELEDKNQILLSKLSKLKEKFETLQEKFNLELQSREESEILYDQLFDKHKKLLILSEKQSEELEILKNPSESSAFLTSAEGGSLQRELQDLEEDFEAEGFESPPKRRLSSSLRNSFKMMARTIGIFKQDPVAVTTKKKQRKAPCEEYFVLATQAIKLNSPYMDSICTINAKKLYENALQNEVPFHKWHLWIENQLNSAYLSGVYAKAR